MSNDSYDEILKQYVPLFDIEKKVHVKNDTGWFFDHAFENDTITISVPAFNENRNAATLVHYLGHARLLQDGWPRFVYQADCTEPSLLESFLKIDEAGRMNTLAYWVSRTEDSFFDFFVWRFVTASVGPEWLKRFLASVATRETSDVVRNFRLKSTEETKDIGRMIFFLDWYAMLPVLAEMYGLKEERNRLLEQFEELSKQDVFTQRYQTKIPETVLWVRNYYETLLKDVPNHQALLENRETFLHAFNTYYRKVWEGTGLEITLTWTWPELAVR